MEAKVVLILATITMAMGSMGCSTISERYIVRVDRRATMDYQKENYTVTEQNGTTTFTLSPKGKAALTKHEEEIAKRKAFREARSNLVMPLANTVDWALSWPAVVVYGLSQVGAGGGPNMGSMNFSGPNLSGIGGGGGIGP
jgi:hypothetical protein